MKKLVKKRFRVLNSKNITLKDIIEIKRSEKKLDKLELRENVEEVFNSIWS